VLALNHGGFEGLGADWNGGLCVAFARAGYATVESSYRGEDGSQGRVEFCLGEVSDVLNMLAIALAQPYADPQRASMLGLSHGGCITARALERGAAVRAAVDVFGPTEAVSLFRSWQARVAAGDPQAPAYRELIARVEQAAGGPPEAVPAAYAARSPLFFVRDLDAWPGALLVVHGTEDALIPVGQSCALAAAGQDFRAFHLGTLLNVIPSPPDACAGLPVAWRSGPHPGPSWPDRRYLVVHEDVGHDFEGLGGGAVLAEVASFLAAKGR
jgi:alpha/beta superfamily hydrolase